MEGTPPYFSASIIYLFVVEGKENQGAVITGVIVKPMRTKRLGEGVTLGNSRFVFTGSGNNENQLN